MWMPHREENQKYKSKKYVPSWILERPEEVSYKTFFRTNKKKWRNLILQYMPWKFYKNYDDKIEAADMYYEYIMRMFFNELVKDMIENNGVYVFEEYGIRMMVGDRPRWSSLYKYKINKRGHDYIPYIYIGKSMMRRLNRYYKMRFTSNTHKIFQKAKREGKEYSIIPNYDY